MGVPFYATRLIITRFLSYLWITHLNQAFRRHTIKDIVVGHGEQSTFSEWVLH